MINTKKQIFGRNSRLRSRNLNKLTKNVMPQGRSPRFVLSHDLWSTERSMRLDSEEYVVGREYAGGMR
jgi:hypothetical protein